MKFLTLISVLCIAVVLGACGGDGESDPSATAANSPSTAANETPSTAANESPSTGTVKEVPGSPVEPKIQVPSEPPPKELVVKQLKEGVGGEGAKPGDDVSLQYVGVKYKTGKFSEGIWDRKQPFSFTLGEGEVVDGWETGLKGMKVGERRELIIPSKLAFGNGPLVYVIELLKIQ